MGDVADGAQDDHGSSEPQLPGARFRIAEPGDAAALMRLKQQLDQETLFMLLEPGERDTSIPALASPAYLVLGVLAGAGGRGIGTTLLAEAKHWAREHGLHRLELTVMAHNRRAFDLYSRMGFSVEGRRSQCLLIDGQFVDELYMAAILG